MLPITVFRVAGHSMEPTLHAGQFVLVNRWAKPKVGDAIVANDIQRNIKVIKRVNKVMDGRLQIVGDNPGHGGERIINKSQVIGKVIWYWIAAANILSSIVWPIVNSLTFATIEFVL
ncbi:helix-turn-helix transcriptional regulator [Candidatus Microgenomates bacterium]|nr:helix-turn-helix transcriptional regulator [Candidatus Microgenomates bacterium]